MARAISVRHLCAAGLRPIVEAICTERGIPDGKVLDETTRTPEVDKHGKEIRRENLEGKIWGLAEHGLITQDQAAMLHKLRYLGNDALHEALAPTETSLEGAIDVVEHILESIYDLPHKASKIRRAKP